MTSVRVVGYKADASIYCVGDAINLYALVGQSPTTNYVDEYGSLYGYDREGNPITPIFNTDFQADKEVCECCHEPLIW